MNFFTKKVEEKPQDVKMLREQMLQFIKEQLGKTEGGEGKNIRGLHFFLVPDNDEKHLYESAVYFNEEDRFKQEVQRIADDYAIELPQDWAMELSFADEIPSEAMRLPNAAAGLFIRTQKRSLQKQATAYIKVLNGEAENEVYTIQSTGGKVTIGRDKKAQSEDGFFRINTIAFSSNSADEANKYISRQHAHIEFDNDAGQFYLYADEGGIPPRNKVKVRSAANDVIKLFSTQIGHALQQGDQIMLGESAILEFSYTND